MSHALVVERVPSVAGHVVVRIPVKGGVGDHHRVVVELPVVAMIREVHHVHAARNAAGDYLERGCPFHRPLGGDHQVAIFETADHCDEVACAGMRKAALGEKLLVLIKTMCFCCIHFSD